MWEEQKESGYKSLGLIALKLKLHEETRDEWKEKDFGRRHRNLDAAAFNSRCSLGSGTDLSRYAKLSV